VLDRLAGDAGGVEAVKFFPLIANPGHLAPGRAHVGGGNVFVRADNVVNLIDEVPREPLQLLDAHPPRVDGDAAFGPAVRQVHDGRFPGH
jgi:hypothetical protein